MHLESWTKPDLEQFNRLGKHLAYLLDAMKLPLKVLVYWPIDLS